MDPFHWKSFQKVSACNRHPAQMISAQMIPTARLGVKDNRVFGIENVWQPYLRHQWEVLHKLVAYQPYILTIGPILMKNWVRNLGPMKIRSLRVWVFSLSDVTPEFSQLREWSHHKRVRPCIVNFVLPEIFFYSVEKQNDCSHLSDRALEGEGVMIRSHLWRETCSVMLHNSSLAEKSNTLVIRAVLHSDPGLPFQLHIFALSPFWQGWSRGHKTSSLLKLPKPSWSQPNLVPYPPPSPSLSKTKIVHVQMATNGF